MADEQPSLHIDTDWKKQAQEEKKRLAEEEQQKAKSEPPPTQRLGTAPSGAPGTRERGARGQRELPPASFATLVQSILTQALFYLGDLATQGMEPTVNLDLAKHQIDTLAVLEEKTKNNLSDADKRLLDAALYEVRMRYVSVASQYT